MVIFPLLAATAVRAATVVLPDVGGTPMSLHVTSLQERRFASTVRQEHDFSCGSAAIATLLSYHYAAPVSEEQVFGEMFRRGDQTKIRREGFSLLDMKEYLDSRGFAADGYKVSLNELAQARIPAIALISEGGYNHFVVIKGVHTDRVLIGDPARGSRALMRAEFERMWNSGIVLVITSNGMETEFNSLKDWDGAPLAPLSAALLRDGLGQRVIAKFGPGGF